MQRRKFLTGALLSLPVLGLAQTPPTPKKRTAKGFVVRAGESRLKEKTLVNGVSPNDVKVSYRDTTGDLTVFEYIGNEKGGPPMHVHPKQDEIFFVIEGEYLFAVGGERFSLKSGDTIFLPRAVPHCFAQMSEKGKMLFMFQPSGKMEDFFKAIGALTAPPSPEEGARIFAAHDMKVVGPGISIS